MRISSVNKKKPLILSVILLTLVLFLILVTGLLSRNQRTDKPQANKQEKFFKVPEYPQVDIRSWVGGQAPASIPPSLRVYDLKEISAEEEAVSLSQKIMGTNQIQKTKKGSYVATIPTTDDLSAFVYNPSKGEFSYASTNGIVLPGVEKAPVEPKINTFLNILFFDPTLKITANYKRKDKPGIVYYEIHRDWDAAGLPILNALGMLNLQENQSLAALTLSPQSDPGQNPDIYSTTDSSDGLARLMTLIL